jgi:TPR repeat protein
MMRISSHNSLPRSGGGAIRPRGNQSFYLYNRSLESLNGRGVPKDPEKSFLLTAQAAEAGMRDAVLAMGWFYLNGIGVEQNIEQAERWYRKSARQGERPRRCLVSGKWRMTNGTMRTLWCGSGERSIKGTPSRYFGLVSCSGEAMVFRQTESKQ